MPAQKLFDFSVLGLSAFIGVGYSGVGARRTRYQAA